jgi:outer membrane protein TolC
LLIFPLRFLHAENLTLSKALEYAEQNCYQAQIGKLEIENAKENISESLSLYYPKIDFSVGHIHLDNDPAFKFGPMVFPAGEQVFWKWDFTLNYTIWDFGRRRKIVESYKKGEEAVSLKVTSDIKLKQVEVTALYMQALTLKDQIDVVKQRKKSLEEHLKVAQNLYEQGVVTRNDVLRTEVALRTLEDQMRILESAKKNVEDSLKKAIGIQIEEEIELVDPMENLKKNAQENGNIPLPPLSFTEEELKEKVLKQNEGLRALQNKIDSLNEVYSLAKKDYYPYVVGALGHSYEQNRYMAYPHLNKLYLGISFNVFDGGLRKSKISQARIELEKAQRDKVETEKEIIVKGLEAYREYLDTIEEYKTAKLNVNSSSENLRIVENQYKEGLLKTTDFLEAETIYAESRFKEIESLHKIITVQAKIAAIVGEDLKNYFSTLY